METGHLNNVGPDLSINRDIGIILAVLESGNSVELPATGFSMFPTLRPGDRVVIQPLTKEELPTPGSVVVCIANGTTAQRHNGAMAQMNNSALVMHRLVEKKNYESPHPLFITRGDSIIESDKPWFQKQLIGVAISYKRGRKEHLVKIFIPEPWRYKFNRKLLWMFIKLTKLKNSLHMLLYSK